MRIIYDGQVYAIQAAGGVSRYFSNLIARLPNNFTPYLTILNNSTTQPIKYPVHPNLKRHTYKRFGWRPGRLSYWLEKYYFRSIANFNSFDIAHPTYYSLLTRQKIDKYSCPAVINVWDMIHEIFSEQMDPTGTLSAEKKAAISAAQAVLCISENTKKDLIERYSLPEEKIKVTYLASEIDVSLSYGSEPVPDRPYYLYVGSRAIYKNFDGFLIAFSKIVSVESNLALCVAGPPFNREEENLIANLKLTNHIIHYPYTTDSHLAKLYRCSIALVYPSRYEGFGIPTLEAMCCGTAVVASNSSSIPEVVGDAGLLFDPSSIGDLADILLFLVAHPAERDRLIAKGYQRAKLFSWDKTASETIDVYRLISN